MFPADKVSQRLVGHRQAGVLAAYSAIFVPNVGEVVIFDPPVTHHDGPHFLNVDRSARGVQAKINCDRTGNRRERVEIRLTEVSTA